MRKFLSLLLLLASPALAQVAIQGNNIQIGGNASAGGVTSLKVAGNPALTGDITFLCFAGLSCSQSGNTVNISLAAPFAITSFSGCSNVELGTSVVNPSFTAGYTTMPASANITNTEGIGSPLTLTSPFTAGTVTGTFVHASTATTTFTLSATQGTTQTTSCLEQWLPAIFAGIGSGGATNSVTASGTTAILSTGDSLARFQLGTESVGQSFGNINPGGEYVYLLLINPGHTFTDANTGFPFAFDAPQTVHFVNVNGTTVTMYLYRSTNPSNVAVQPKVTT
jgi:hypothetical protein